MAMHVEQNRQLNRVSVMALNEFNELKKKYEIEVELRKEAEDIATKAVAEKNLDDRKSRMISMHVDNNEQLDVYMKEIDELNALSEQYKRESEKKIKELEEQISSSEDTQSVTALEERLALVMDQLELAQNQLVEAEERSTKAEENSRQLYSRLAQAERGRTSSVVLPPPPPPPPPPIAAPVIRKFIIRIGKRKKDGNTVDIAGQEEDPRIQAMSEMMDRIKKGVGLRPVNSPVKVGDKDEEDGSAMNELAGLLDKMRKGRSDSKENLADMSETKQPEFIKVKLKKSAKPSFEMESAAAPTSELKKKLEKQKSIAEGLDDSAPATKKKPVPIPQDGKSRSASEIKNETAENNERKKDLDDQVNSPVVSDKDSMTNTQDEKVDITSNDDVKPISQHDEPKKETPTKKPDAEPENITNETNGKQENVVKQPDSKEENDIKEMNNKGSTSDSVDAKEKLETSDSLIERKEENDNKKKSIDENLSVSNVKNDGERNSENWEIEMVIDATKRQTSDQKVDETPSADVLQREHRKSVDEIFDSMLSDINSSIEKNTDKSS